MSTLTEEARELLDVAQNAHHAEAATAAGTSAVAVAVLALVEQQRLANLIAWWETNGRLTPEAQQQITEGLGL